MNRALIILVVLLSSCFFEEEIKDKQDIWSYALPSDIRLNNSAFSIINDSLKSGYYGDVKSLIIIKNDQIIFENYYDGQFRNHLRPMGVATSVIVAATLGQMISDGYLSSLDTPIFKLLPQYANIFDAEPEKKEITVRHLLNHRSGLSWNESIKLYISRDNDLNKMKSDADWGAYVIRKDLSAAPGSRTATNTGSSILLSVLMQNVLGSVDLEAYIDKNLFEPIGITKYNWVRDPTGNLDGASGLFLSELDFARIGYLFSEKGEWKKNQVIDPLWVEQSLFAHSNGAEFNYGYGWRLLADKNATPIGALDGDIFLSPYQHGQFVFSYPKKNLLVIIYAENYAYQFYSPTYLLFLQINNIAG